VERVSRGRNVPLTPRAATSSVKRVTKPALEWTCWSCGFVWTVVLPFAGALAGLTTSRAQSSCVNELNLSMRHTSVANNDAHANIPHSEAHRRRVGSRRHGAERGRDRAKGKGWQKRVKPLLCYFCLTRGAHTLSCCESALQRPGQLRPAGGKQGTHLTKNEIQYSRRSRS
jgi:hypothetical protein